MDQSTSKELGDLIISITKGNVEAIDIIYHSFGSAMFKVAKYYVRNVADAEDIVQDTLVKIVEKAHLFRENKNAYAWIHTIVKNTAMDYLRISARTPRLYTELDSTYEMNDSELEVCEALDCLTKKERDMIVYTYWYEMSYEEVASACHIVKSTVSYRIRKAFEKIKKFYEK